MKIVDVVVSTMTKTEMSCNRLTQTLRRINESMLPDFSLSLLPLLFFCPFLFGVNEPRNERDSRTAGEYERTADLGAEAGWTWSERGTLGARVVSRTEVAIFTEFAHILRLESTLF